MDACMDAVNRAMQECVPRGLITALLGFSTYFVYGEKRTSKVQKNDKSCRIGLFYTWYFVIKPTLHINNSVYYHCKH